MKQRAHWFARNEQAEALEKAGRKAEALALYEANAREGCDLSFTYERLGVLYEEQGKLAQALDALEQARQIEQRRGPSVRLVRLIRQIEALQRRLHQQTSRQSTRPPRSRTTVERDSQLPRVAATTKQRKGCLGMTLLGLVGVGGLFGWLL